MNRREFLRQAVLLSGAALVSFGTRGWAARVGQAVNNSRRLIVIFLRGAVDGLNVVVPYGDDRYYQARTSIAIPKAGTNNGVLDLDGYFGLHPSLAPLMPYWRNQTMGFVHASGSPDPNRSHFEAQAYMETGAPGDGTVTSGWMNRLVGAMPGTHTPSEALGLGAVLPRILTGPNAVSNLPLGRNAGRPLPIDRPQVADAYAALYQGDSSVDQAFKDGRQSRGELMSDIRQDMENSYNGAPDVIGFSSDTTRLAQLMQRDARVRLGFLSVGGWDTHVNQGASQGQLATHLAALGQGLNALVQGLGPLYQESLVLVM
ncbi:MAG: DUF1501 domain-containing protein, partial [Gammaproteobacteria bacterium]|nr:DUF1501 domain-containing protein [Gammaproteobacteria bacterium]